MLTGLKLLGRFPRVMGILGFSLLTIIMAGMQKDDNDKPASPAAIEAAQQDQSAYTSTDNPWR